MTTFAEMAASGAFLYHDQDYPDIAVTISGAYLTPYYRKYNPFLKSEPGTWEAAGDWLEGTPMGPDYPRRDGFYSGTTAMQILDAARTLVQSLAKGPCSQHGYLEHHDSHEDEACRFRPARCLSCELDLPLEDEDRLCDDCEMEQEVLRREATVEEGQRNG